MSTKTLSDIPRPSDIAAVYRRAVAAERVEDDRRLMAIIAPALETMQHDAAEGTAPVAYIGNSDGYTGTTINAADADNIVAVLRGAGYIAERDDYHALIRVRVSVPLE